MRREHTVARVVVDVPARALTDPFDYRVPDDLRGRLAVGCPVAVPLGRRVCVGYVVGLGAETDYAGTLKDVLAVLGEPLFDGAALGVAQWVAREYCAPLSESLRLFLPPGGAPRAVRTEHGWRIEGRQMAPMTETLVTLGPNAAHFEPRPSATVQRAVLHALAEGPVTLAELAAELPGARNAVRALAAVGAVECVERRRYRRPPGSFAPSAAHALTSEQAEAVRLIESCAEEGGGVVLLEGVTGSGKTEVYLTVIERALSRGKGAIVLVPEISLTPQTVGRFRNRLGDAVAVLHSRLSAGERFDQWQLALQGAVRVVVGARSALFAPVSNLGLVVIDEEHEPSYKQGQSPRYHARAVAEQLCAAHGATLVLGSATPSMETLRRVETGAYRRASLTRRLGGGAPARVEVVDMTAEFASGHRSMYSRRLKDALAGVVERREKAVLFLNRRGYASFLLCRECGFVPRCAACSVSLTYHERPPRLLCHHCGLHEPVPATCPRCGSAYLRQFGAGTERAEAELLRILPEARVVRMDADTTSRKGSHETTLATFERLESAVLLGTQMIAKGLDYPDVTLVGVLNADTSMHLPDFRAAERTYQLLEQVAGRAGRGPKGGTVVIQTYWPDHPAIRAVETGDPDVLYAREREERRALGFPPYGRIANVVFTGAAEPEVERAARAAAGALEAALGAPFAVVGPSPAPIARLKGQWRWHVLVKGDEQADVPGALDAALRGVKTPHGVTMIIDVDPVSLM